MDESFEVQGLDESFVEVPSTPHKEWPCDSCSYRSGFKANLERHKRSKHPSVGQKEKVQTTDPSLCQDCGKTFRTRYGLTLHHKSVHTKTFRFTCAVCSRGFNTLWNYRGHIASHEKALKVKCTFCKETFQYQSSLLRHTCPRNTSTKKQLTCDTCDATFQSLDARREHYYAKHDGRVLTCDTCGKGYKWRSSLAHHKTVCNK